MGHPSKNLFGGEDALDDDGGAAFAGIAELGGSSIAEVYHAARKEGAAIIDFNDDGFTGFGVGNTRIARDRHGFMRTGHAIHIVNLAR